MGTIVYQEEKIIDLPLHASWEMATDTNHFNHYAKLFHVQFSPLQMNEGDMVREAKAKVFGFVPTTWREYTFAWVRNEWFEIERIYLKSPMKRVLWKISLEPISDTQTRMRVDGDFTYANLLGKVALERIVIPQLRSIFQYADEYAQSFHQHVIRPQAKQQVDIQLSVLEKRLDRLLTFPVNRSHMDMLVDDVRHANDEDVTGMRPYKWARERGVARDEALNLFLLATKAGLLQQRWSMLCPNCRVPKQQVESLRNVMDTIHCDLCGVDYAIDFDRSIEMQFDVDPSIRKSAGLLYCINGPMNSAHILAQFRIPAGQSFTYELPDWKTTYRYRVLQKNDTVDVQEDGELVSELTYSDQGFTHSKIRPSKELTISNTCAHEIVFMIEELDITPDALTARELTSLQVFRDLFATEVLSPDQEIQVGQLTVLFTDLKESTAMYERIGDALAYSTVRTHFSYLKKYVQAHRGAVVKTIGDAVMAVFTNEQDAYNAACAIQQNVHELKEQGAETPVIKLGFHQGSVIAVNANDLLDYFGRTVNMAARVQQFSVGNDVVITKDMYSQLEIPKTQTAEQFEKVLKGIKDPVELVRLVF